METLKYKIIKSREQYNQYYKILENLLLNGKSSVHQEDEIELLTLLIEQWDRSQSLFENYDPVQIIQLLMKEHHLNQQDLTEILGVSKSLTSQILNYRRGLSKLNIRTLTDRFKISQEVLNKPYKLKDDKEVAL